MSLSRKQTFGEMLHGILEVTEGSLCGVAKNYTKDIEVSAGLEEEVCGLQAGVKVEGGPQRDEILREYHVRRKKGQPENRTSYQLQTQAQTRNELANIITTVWSLKTVHQTKLEGSLL